MKFRKKPVVVEAYQITRSMIDAVVLTDCPYPKGLTLRSASYNHKTMSVNSWFGNVITIHGQITRVVENDWIISEGDGIHFYPCKPDIFDKTYESAEENNDVTG